MGTKAVGRLKVQVSEPEAAPHERIVQVARELFCRDGIHATGIDRILSEASASKMTLYARFGSKDGLLREVLQQEGAEWRQRFFAGVEAGGLPSVVDSLAAMFDSGRFYGCAFMNAIGEHTKGAPWLREMAAEHHKLILAFLEGYAAGYPEPALLARQLLLLIDGTVAALMVTGDRAVLEVAERNLRAILRV
jgi:AcrR family transcriptional regulator